MMIKLYVDFGGYSAIEKGNLIIPRENILNKEDFDRAELGEVVDIYSKKGKFLGRGFKNPYEVRIMTLRKEELDEKYIRDKITKANEFRLKIGYKESYRMVYTQSDWLNGLIIDKFNDIATIQIFNYGIEKFRDVIVETLVDLGIESIFEKSSGRNRRRAGLKDFEKHLYGTKKETIITEGEAKFIVRFDGQKTGFFLDQRENRIFLEEFIKEGDKVLDVCCYTGGFSVHAALRGGYVVGVDLSKKALKVAEENMELNKIPKDKYEFIEGNAFEVMESFLNDNISFDTVILDPPAFAQSKKSLKNALKGYHYLNRLGAKLTKNLLVSCSCSQPVSMDNFKALVIDAVLKAKKWGRIFYIGSQARDHPITSKGTEYLKCLFLDIEKI
ncbi:class I SAM-dependent rRNA methyltransferase [Methanocaldococcus indicus]|uniref:class I SAM-dependent rRNA methyltransferase n=1 Tax=Methanocaldococcus indicus TaxID=213231 RepID=UPI003C6D3586